MTAFGVDKYNTTAKRNPVYSDYGYYDQKNFEVRLDMFINQKRNEA